MRFDYLHEPVPEFVESLLAVRLPRRFYGAAATLATLLLATAATSGIEMLRLRVALSLEQRAASRFEQSRAALNAAQLQWQQLDALVARDRRLREVRLSGSVAALQIAQIGNGVTHGAWLTSVTPAFSSYALKGYARDLPALRLALANIEKSAPGIGEPQELRLWREDRGRWSPLNFDVRLGPAP